MTSPAAEASARALARVEPRRAVVVTALGLAQILAWGSSYYLLAVLAKPIAGDTGWPLPWVVGGLSLGLLVAGLVSPRVGNAIERHGGRPVLAISAVLLAVGLLGLAFAPNLPAYLAAWIVLGFGMGAGLYDAAFATLGRRFGQYARQTITTLTLFGGFASTACWPLSAFVVSEVGWRGACLVYAALLLLVVLPLYLFALPREEKRSMTTAASHGQPAHVEAAPDARTERQALLFLLLATAITIISMISAVISVHLLTMLQARDIALAAAVALGALIGPSQVGARAIEMMISRYHHPIWTLLASTILLAMGLGALWAGLPLVSAALVFYGAGLGIESIARGTLPLALFGATGYASVMGRLAMPSLIAQAVSPIFGALLMTRFGANAMLAILLAAAILAIMTATALFVLMPSASRQSSPPILTQ